MKRAKVIGPRSAISRWIRSASGLPTARSLPPPV
jgi:hypothetical protein